MNQHSPHADLPTLSSTSPITATRTELQPQPSQTNTTTHHHHRRRRILHPNGTHPPSEPTPTELRDAAARSAKLSIREKLREDWEWDPAASLLHRLQDSPACDPTVTNGTTNGNTNGTTHFPHDDADDTVSDDSTNAPTWLEREPDSSDASSTTATDPAHHLPTSQTYKFDTPDSLTTHILSRKRARRLALDDEMRWNDGLRTFVLRRDDWTGGRVKLVHHTLPPAPVTLRHPPPPADSSTAQATTVAIKTELVPLAPPLLPHTHPIRANINPQTYPSIYSKVVVQGLAPTVPINLRDMTSALVVGWKEDDLWPPKNTAVPEAAVAVRKKGRGGEGGGGGGGGDGGGGDGGGRNGEREKGERERGLAKGVGAFKRALGLGVGVGGNVERGCGRESGTV